MKYFVSGIIAIVAAAIVAGFFIVGSPQEERLRRFDDRRLGDLQTIQSQVVNYWQRKNKLPTTLSDLTDSISGFKAPQDPADQSAYEYRATGALSFELCATFARANDGKLSALGRPHPVEAPEGASGSPIDQNWAHAAGRVCFDRTIDPDFYRPQPVPVKGRD